MRFMKWVTIMWAIVGVGAALVSHWMAAGIPQHSGDILYLGMGLAAGLTAVGMVALAPVIVLGWIGLMVWRFTGSRKEPPHIEVIQPIRPPAEPPPGADAGHRWLG